MTSEIKIILNGCDEVVSNGATINDLLELLGENDQHLIVEHNGLFVPPFQYADREVREGDIIEFINPNLGG